MNIKSIGSKIKGNPTKMEGTVYSILIICGISHFLNDMIQSIIPSIYPIIKDKFDFSFAQIGIITLMFQMASSILQPFTGLYADKHPRPYALSVGMCFTLIGLLMLAFSENYLLILLSVSIVGLGSSVFHPTASRVAQLASGGRKSLAQQRWLGDRSSPCSPHHPAFRTACHLVVCPCRLARRPYHDQIRGMVQGPVGVCGDASAEKRHPEQRHLEASKIWGTAHPRAAHLLEVFLYLLHHELLHLLPDRQVWHLGTGFSAVSVRLSCRLCHWYCGWRYVG